MVVDGFGASIPVEVVLCAHSADHTPDRFALAHRSPTAGLVQELLVVVSICCYSQFLGDDPPP